MVNMPALVVGGTPRETASADAALDQLPALLTASSKPLQSRSPPSTPLSTQLLPSRISPHHERSVTQSGNLSEPSFTPLANAVPPSTLILNVGPAGLGIMAGSCNSCPCLDGRSDLPAPVAGSVTMESIGISNCLDCGHPIWIHQGFVDYSRLQAARVSQMAVNLQAPDFYPEGWVHVRSQLFCPRVEDVRNITQRLHRYNYIHLNGSPACGKTTLAYLVGNQLHQEGWKIYYLAGWRQKSVTEAGGWQHYMKEHTGITGTAWLNTRAVFILDECQEAYWDDQFWCLFIKAVEQSQFSPRVLTIAPYGSARTAFEPEEVLKTPIVVAPEQVINLWPDPETPSVGLKPVGLLLNKSDCDEVIERRTTPEGSAALQPDLRFFIHLLTAGHVGAVEALVGIFKAEKPPHGKSSWSLTDAAPILNHPTQFFRSIRGSRFARGLPSREDLTTEMGTLMRYLVSADPGVSPYALPPWLRPALLDAHRSGWLGTLPSGELAWASNLHRWFIIDSLGMLTPEPLQNFRSPMEFLEACISRFCPRYLRNKTRSASQTSPVEGSPCETEYTQEFYRTANQLLKGGITICPEFVTSTDVENKGKIDFLIQEWGWGFEFLRDYDRIKEHAQRFSPGGKYDVPEIREHLLINATTRVPTRTLEYENFYHLLFTEEFHEARIICCRTLEILKTYNLLNNASIWDRREDPRRELSSRASVQ